MRILYIITGLAIGGAERITIDIANNMLKKGHAVSIIYLTGENMHHDIHPDILLRPIHMKKNPVGLLNALIQAVQFIKEWKPDIIHSQMYHANIFSRLLKLMYPHFILICTEHNKYIGGKTRMWTYRLTNRFSDFNTNVSEEATTYFIQSKAFKASNTTTIYNGIDLKRFYKSAINLRSKFNISDNTFVFINVGRLTKAKDQANLIKAFHKLSAIYNNIQLIIVGEGEEKKNLQKLAQDLGIQNQILFHKVTDQIEKLYNVADCFVLSSSWEGFGIVIAEAMACELPAITTNAGGCAEVIGNQRFLIPIKDTDALFNKMKEIYNMNKEERIELGKRNRELSQRFNLENICNQWVSLYKKLLNNR